MFQPPKPLDKQTITHQLCIWRCKVSHSAMKSIDSWQESMGSSQCPWAQKRAPTLGHSVVGGGPASMMLLLVKHQVSRAPQMNSDNFCLKRPSFVKNPSTQLFDPCLGVNPSYSVGNNMIAWYGIPKVVCIVNHLRFLGCTSNICAE